MHCSETAQNQSCIESVCVKSLSRVQLFETPWTSARQAPPSMGFSRQEYWSGVPFPSPEDLPKPRIEPGSPALQADSLLSELPGESGIERISCKITVPLQTSKKWLRFHINVYLHVTMEALASGT